MKFKEKPLEIEFERAHPRVMALAVYLDWYSVRYLGREAIVTDVDRTQEEYDAIYTKAIEQGNYWLDANGVRHYAGPRPHLYDKERCIQSRAVDFRSFIYSGPEIQRLLDHMNANWPRTDGKPTLLYHHVGQHGAHLHLQAQVI